MTNVKIRQHDDILRVHVEGHTSDPKVCAACSILDQTLLQCLRDLANGGAIELYQDEVNEESGSMYIKAKTTPGSKQAVGLMLGVIATGFMLLEEYYPDDVKLNFRQVMPDNKKSKRGGTIEKKGNDIPANGRIKRR